MNREFQWKLLDNYRRKLFLKNEIKNLFFKNIIKNTNLPIAHRYYAMFKRIKTNHFYSSTRVQKRCVITGRIWSINKTTNFSRFYFRTNTNYGNIPGFKRASW